MPSQNQDLEDLSSRDLSQISTRGNAALEERLSRLRDAVRDLERRMIDCENIMAEQFKCTESTVSTGLLLVARCPSLPRDSRSATAIATLFLKKRNHDASAHEHRSTGPLQSHIR